MAKEKRPMSTASARDKKGVEKTLVERKQVLRKLKKMWATLTLDSQGDRMTRDELHERS